MPSRSIARYRYFFMRDLEGAMEEHFSQVAQAEFVAQSPKDDQEHDVGRQLEIVEGRARRFIELASAGVTPRDKIAQLGTLG